MVAHWTELEPLLAADVRVRAAERLISLEKTLTRRQEDEARRTGAVFDQLRLTLQAAVEGPGPLQLTFDDLADAERQQLDRDRRAWQTRLDGLTLPVVHRAFPGGLAPVLQDKRARVRALVAEMLDGGGASRHAVIQTMLRDVLDWQQHLRIDTQLPDSLAEVVAEHGIVVRPDFGFYAEETGGEHNEPDDERAGVGAERWHHRGGGLGREPVLRGSRAAEGAGRAAEPAAVPRRRPSRPAACTAGSTVAVRLCCLHQEA